MHKSARSKGFTLVEVMVALMVFAIATVGLQTTIEQSALTVSRLEEKTLANVVANNKLLELRSLNVAPAQGRQTSEVDMGKRTWMLETEVKSTSATGLLQIEIRVGLAEDQGKIRQVTQLRGFVHG